MVGRKSESASGGSFFPELVGESGVSVCLAMKVGVRCRHNGRGRSLFYGKLEEEVAAAAAVYHICRNAAAVF